MSNTSSAEAIRKGQDSVSESLLMLDGPIDSDGRIHSVVVVINGQNLLAIDANVDKGQISSWKPKAVDLLGSWVCEEIVMVFVLRSRDRQLRLLPPSEHSALHRLCLLDHA